VPPGTRHLINPGSVGQPRDCDWRAAFAIYDNEACEIVYHRVPYHLNRAQGRILMARLPERLAARLREGR
jgi:diadenosine tetraphosphatase ApaH/serine/threonine PP2A family protein phosphatase